MFCLYNVRFTSNILVYAQITMLVSSKANVAFAFKIRNHRALRCWLLLYLSSILQNFVKKIIKKIVIFYIKITDNVLLRTIFIL